MNDHPTQPPLGATPEPSDFSALIYTDEQLVSRLREVADEEKNGDRWLENICRQSADKLSTARAALAQCEERLKALTYEHSRLCRQFGDELRADEAAQRKEDIEAHEGQRMRDVLDYRMDNPCSDDFK